MTSSSLPQDDRLLDLLALRAAEGLSADAESALGDWSGCESLDEAAAVLAIGLAIDEAGPTGLDPMPGDLRDRLTSVALGGWDAAELGDPDSAQPLAGSAQHDRSSNQVTGSSSQPAGVIGRVDGSGVSPAGASAEERRGGSLLITLAGWVAAAACLAVLITSFAPEPAPTPEMRLAELEQRPGVVRSSWLGLDDASLSEAPHRYDQSLTGTVVWDNESNEGYLVFEGLAANDPSEFQYQLWIFDAGRPTGQLPQHGDGILSQRPIDGGVFDAAGGRVVVPIDPKLAVFQAAIFAVTVEQPGGVVVSDRDIVTLAILD